MMNIKEDVNSIEPLADDNKSQHMRFSHLLPLSCFSSRGITNNV
jgi:hypothetical protein